MPTNMCHTFRHMSAKHFVTSHKDFNHLTYFLPSCSSSSREGGGETTRETFELDNRKKRPWLHSTSRVFFQDDVVMGWSSKKKNSEIQIHYTEKWQLRLTEWAVVCCCIMIWIRVEWFELFQESILPRALFETLQTTQFSGAGNPGKLESNLTC